MNIRHYLFIITACAMTACTSNNIPDIGQGFKSDKLEAPWHGKTDNTNFDCYSTEDRIYFNFNVIDHTLTLNETEAGERVVDNEDRAEIFFSPVKSLKKDYFCAEIDAAGRIMDYKARYYRDFDFSWNFKTMEAEGKLTPEGYQVRGSVSRSELESLGIDLCKGFWIGAYRGDSIKNGDIEWYSLVPVNVKDPDFHVPGVMFKCKATPRL